MWYVPKVTGVHKVSMNIVAVNGRTLRGVLNAPPSSDFLPFLFQVTVLFAGQHIAKSPFEVNVDKSHGDASKVTAQGPGLEPIGNIANKTTYFEIFTAGQ